MKQSAHKTEDLLPNKFWQRINYRIVRGQASAVPEVVFDWRVVLVPVLSIVGLLFVASSFFLVVTAPSVFQRIYAGLGGFSVLVGMFMYWRARFDRD